MTSTTTTTITIGSGGGDDVHLLPGKEVRFTYCYTDPVTNGTVSCTIPLMVDMGVGIGGDTWPAAELFCALITSKQYQQSFFATYLFHESSRVLELGSGHGLVSILISKVFRCKDIVVSDLPAYLDMLRGNLALNRCTGSGYDASNLVDTQVISKVEVEALDWTKVDPSDTSQTKYDVILALECVYKEELYKPLIDTLLAKGHQKTIAILGITRQFASESFFTLLRARGFRYKKIPQSTMQHVFDDQNSHVSMNKHKYDISHIGILVVYKE